MNTPIYNPPISPNTPVPKTWFGRNWKWFVPTLTMTFVSTIGLFALIIVSFVFGLIRSSEPYQIAIQRAQQSPVVWAKIGRPVHVGRFSSGSINYDGYSGNADLSIPISGPRGKGHIEVSAKKQHGKWTYQTLEVDVDGEDTVIPLLSPGISAPAENVKDLI